jgi:hypothetical protein
MTDFFSHMVYSSAMMMEAAGFSEMLEMSTKLRDVTSRRQLSLYAPVSCIQRRILQGGLLMRGT